MSVQVFLLPSLEKKPTSLLVPAINLPSLKLKISNYEKELEEMKHMTRQEFVAAIRR